MNSTNDADDRRSAQPAPASPPVSETTQPTPPGIRRWLTLLTILTITLAISVCLLLVLHRNSRGARVLTDNRPAAASHRHASFRAAEGPWGRLDALPILLSPPREVAPPLNPIGVKTLAWRFPKLDPPGLSELLDDAGVPASLREKIVSQAEPDPAAGGLIVRPAEETVLGMSPEVRGLLYELLAGLPGNADQRTAYRFPGASADEWFAGSDVSAATRKLVDPLIYRRGGLLCFADERCIDHRLPDEEERWRLNRALSRFKTSLIRLEVSPQCDIEALVEYWGRGDRARDVRPILESVNCNGEARSIDVRHLLPALPQHLIYSYPHLSDHDGPFKTNCHWTSLNFFNETPIDMYALPGEIDRMLNLDYYPISSPGQLGDLALFYNDDDRIIHSATFIADDVYFTKNGRDVRIPWIFATLDEIQQFYSTIDVRYCRHQDH